MERIGLKLGQILVLILKISISENFTRVMEIMILGTPIIGAVMEVVLKQVNIIATGYISMTT